MNSVKIDQKEYLRKYLNDVREDVTKRKQKKKRKLGTKTVQIIDDDIDIRNIRRIDEDEYEILNNTEDGPQIVGVIDEQGRAGFGDKKRWKIIADDGEGNVACGVSENHGNDSKKDLGSRRDERLKDFQEKHEIESKESKNTTDDDLPLPRKPKPRSRDSDHSDLEEKRSRRKESSKRHRSDKKSHDSSSSESRRKEKRGRRLEIVRNIGKKDSRSNEEYKSSMGSDSDQSPPRRTKNYENKIKTERTNEQDILTKKLNSDERSEIMPAVVMRDRRTGRKRDLIAEANERREKEKRQKEIDEKYAKWGKGLKQVENEREKDQRDLHEMSKPFSRYADDEDLDKALREVEREGDPMLDEIKKRRIKEGKCQPEKPSYRGSFPPNRFGIKPGYRWDGVDRSNGYEKKWFEAQNSRAALREEAYKWSTADM